MASAYSRLLKFFGIGKSKDKISGKETLRPVNIKSDGKESIIKFTPDVERLFQYFLTETRDTSKTLKNRISRYADMEYAYYNNSIVSMAIDLYADETIQADSQDQVLQVYANNPDVVKFIYDFFDKIGVNAQMIRSIAFDLALYGDSFLINTIDDANGIIELVPVEPHTVNERIEFNPILEQRIANNTGLSGILSTARSQNNLINQLALAYEKSMSNNDITASYKPYLFGYKIEGESFLPPWAVTHFRLYSTRSEFAPYGRPILINSIGPFRQLEAAKNLMSVARALNFPKEFFEVNTGENRNPVDQFKNVNEARQEYHNMVGGTTTVKKDEFSLNSEVWLPKESITYHLESPNINIGDIADIELLQDNLIMGTRVPKGYLIVDRASFGTSGQALLQQFKPFGRAVYQIQTAILKGFTQLVRIQFVLTGKYDYDEPFEILMPFPVVEESADRSRAKGDSVRLVKDVLDVLASSLGMDPNAGWPEEIVKEVFSQLSFIDKDDLDSWINKYMKWSKDNAAADTTDSGDGNDFYSFESEEGVLEEIKKLREENNKKLIENYFKAKGRISEELVKEVEWRVKKNHRIHEGTINKKHFYSSYNIDPTETRVIEGLVSIRTKKKAKL